MSTRLTLLLLLLTFATSCSAISYCTDSDKSCWPVTTDISTLRAALDTSLTRNLTWPGQPFPRPCAVPYGSTSNQSFYGYTTFKPFYVLAPADTLGTCFNPSTFYTEFCLVSVRNNPLNGVPYFVAWPVNTAQVQTLVRFANDHNLCVSVAGTGHDFLNRHTCENYPGMLIRMSLLKNATVNTTDSRGPAGTISLGAGHTFSEAQYIANQYNSFLATGWASTVGIVGWSLGGGHGPFAPSTGLGVDNVVEAEVVLANGTVVVANATSYSDLWVALRGGGGSTWGIVTRLTMRLHRNPVGGFAMAQIVYSGNLCTDNTTINSFVDWYIDWSQSLSTKWGGLGYFGYATTSCSAYTLLFQYVYRGPANDSEYSIVLGKVPKDTFRITTTSYATWYDYLQTDLEYIIPISLQYSTNPAVLTPGGIPSVLVNSSIVNSGALAAQIKARMQDCVKNSSLCNNLQLYHDITGNPNSTRADNVSITPAFRNAVFHYVSTGWTGNDFKSKFYTLGDYAYFSESAYILSDWKTRYWGSNYESLLAVKTKYDPAGRFGCRHCVGDTSVDIPSVPATSAGKIVRKGQFTLITALGFTVVCLLSLI